MCCWWRNERTKTYTMSFVVWDCIDVSKDGFRFSVSPSISKLSKFLKPTQRETQMLLLPLLISITISSSYASIESDFNHVFLTKINQENSLTRTEVRSTEKMGRGVYATTDIQQDDVLFTVRTHSHSSIQFQYPHKYHH